MPPIILSAKDYGFRKVIRVCMNPDQPESVHVDGKAHVGIPTVGTPPGLKPWEWCHDCRYNWDVREFVWTGDELRTHGKTGKIRPKTDAELLAEIKSQLVAQPPVRQISGLQGR